MPDDSEALRKRTERARAQALELFHIAPIAHLILGPGGDIIEANQRVHALGIERKDWSGARLTDFVSRHERKELDVYLRRARAGIDDGWVDLTLILRNGAKVLVWLRAAPAGRSVVVTMVERPREADELHRMYVRKVLGAQDEERRRLALELHDELGQTLGALEVGLAHVEYTSSDPATRERVARLRATLERAGIEVRRLAHGLYPRVLDDHGLGAAIERLVADTQSMSGIPVRLRGMRERIEALGGVFRVRSLPGSGTVVGFEVPLRREDIHSRDDHDAASR